MKNSTICFFIGTEAELIKVFTIIRELDKRQINYRIISSGQNDIRNSRALSYVRQAKIDVLLSEERKIKKSTLGLFKWFFATLFQAKKKIKHQLQDIDFQHSIMLVHGDTLSTVMGAFIGRSLKMKVAHIEAGLRSHHLLHPFPEEINRQITSLFARIHFAPDETALNNLYKAKGEKINTFYNTIIESIAATNDMPCQTKIVQKIISTDYFVLVLHRQENLANKSLLKRVITRAVQAAKNIPCVFVMHKPTEVILKSMGIYDKVAASENIILIPRTDYFDFTSLLKHAKFVVSDGGSNQEELSYMGKPCLIVRSHTERSHGIGENAVLMKEDDHIMDDFFDAYASYERQPIVPESSPVQIISDYLEKQINIIKE